MFFFFEIFRCFFFGIFRLVVIIFFAFSVKFLIFFLNLYLQKWHEKMAPINLPQDKQISLPPEYSRKNTNLILRNQIKFSFRSQKELFLSPL